MPPVQICAGFSLKIAGAGRKRAEFQRMLDELRNGDRVVAWKLDRLVHSTRDLVATMETIHETGAYFESLCELWANTTRRQADYDCVEAYRRV
jgi:DNA invertase Pin-like site-specific DNA recombinase